MKPFLLIPIVFLSLHAYGQGIYDIVIDEIMADPTPQIGLPNNEWIELKNVSPFPVNLQNWRIGDKTGQSGAMPNFVLQPDSFVIVCPGSAAAALSTYGPVISVTSFPSLDNEGDQVFIRSASGKIIHAISFTTQWYANDIKKEGGWSLEMIDTRSPCSGMTNWRASNNPAGGTPGMKNSIDAINNDTSPPQLKNAYTTDSTSVILVFNEPLDSSSGAIVSNYSIDDGIMVTNATPVAPLFDQVHLKMNSPFAANKVYTITVNGAADCKGNSISTQNKVKTGLPVDPTAGEWIINEILFNPRSNGYDYVEFYNNSSKIFDAAKLFVANRNSSGAISSIKILSTTPWYIFPGDYLIATENANNLALNYLVKYPENILELPSLPSFPDDEGDVITLTIQGTIVDEVKYKHDWHFKLISNDEGVALERIDPSAPSQDPANWHSAASTAGYGTPGYKNSQYRQVSNTSALIEVSPKIFSPDNDGVDDIASVKYKMEETGYVANIIVFDAMGRAVRNLVRNELLGLSGYWNWDGLDDKGARLPPGIYIVYTEVFNLRGKRDKFKNVIVLARRLN